MDTPAPLITATRIQILSSKEIDLLTFTEMSSDVGAVKVEGSEGNSAGVVGFLIEVGEGSPVTEVGVVLWTMGGLDLTRKSL